ncbi:caspase-1-like [Etheostoma cragini]|uniref:caspase-1-like n=1 Tax=Etheostoma cragini TaxID=417921 RepID=UPI00155EA57D|nr:caspase-1-like [Etheostoma cragini]
MKLSRVSVSSPERTDGTGTGSPRTEGQGGVRSEDSVSKGDNFPSSPILYRIPGVPKEDSVPAEKTLLRVRTQFVARVSDALLNQVLDYLLERGVLSYSEMEGILTRTGTRTRADKARDVVDTVIKKGREASSLLVSALCELDPVLSRELGLR